MEFPKAFRNERLLFLKKSRLLAALEKEITLLRKRKPKRQGSRSQTGKHLPQRRPMPFQRVNRSWQQQQLCRRKGEFTWHMCLFPRI